MPGDPFYSTPRWRTLRREALRRDGYRCVVCQASVAGKGQSRVDHIKTRQTHPHLALELSNVRTLCALHDNQAHREKAGSGAVRVERFSIKGCDADGWPLHPQPRASVRAKG